MHVTCHDHCLCPHPILTQLSTSSLPSGSRPWLTSLNLHIAYVPMCFPPYEFVLGDVLLCWWCTTFTEPTLFEYLCEENVKVTRFKMNPCSELRQTVKLWQDDTWEFLNVVQIRKKLTSNKYQFGKVYGERKINIIIIYTYAELWNFPKQ